ICPYLWVLRAGTPARSHSHPCAPTPSASGTRLPCARSCASHQPSGSIPHSAAFRSLTISPRSVISSSASIQPRASSSERTRVGMLNVISSPSSICRRYTQSHAVSTFSSTAVVITPQPVLEFSAAKIHVSAQPRTQLDRHLDRQRTPPRRRLVATHRARRIILAVKVGSPWAVDELRHPIQPPRERERAWGPRYCGAV